jgi:purine-cytosine permease-like protein
MIFEEKHEITDIAIIIIVCLAAVIIGVIGVYTYYKSYEAFIAYISTIFLTYSTISLVYTFLNKSDYEVNEYNINLGLDITAVFIALCLTIFFSIKSFYIIYNQPVKVVSQYY